jgi:acyl CoA:acetate/3-ketoacid CoA transferase alpha subunit
MFVDTLLGALAKRKDVTKLTGVSNNAGQGDSGLGMFAQIIFFSQTTIYRGNSR